MYIRTYSAMCGYRTCSRGRMQEKKKSCPGCSWFVCCAFAVLVPRSFHMNVQYVMCVCVSIRWGSTRCEGGGHFSGACEKVWCRKVRVVKSSTCRYSPFWSLSFFPCASLFLLFPYIPSFITPFLPSPLSFFLPLPLLYMYVPLFPLFFLLPPPSPPLLFLSDAWSSSDVRSETRLISTWRSRSIRRMIFRPTREPTSSTLTMSKEGESGRERKR